MFAWSEAFPSISRKAIERDRLNEALWEHPADFIIVMRLAQHFGCQQDVVRRVMAVRHQFLLRNAELLPDWLREYERGEMEEDDPLRSTSDVFALEFHECLDQACETYRQNLLEAIEGREAQIGEALASFLGDLPIPHGPLANHFLDDDDWWKRGEE